jgi:hypothetical protein
MPVADEPRARLARRLAGAGVALAAASPLVIGAMLAPDGAGHGTHTQLGLPACGWVAAFDRPCPTCGMTTAFAHAARGDLLEAFTSQPMGLLLALGAAGVFWGGVHTLATGVRLGGLVSRLLSARALWAAAGIAGLAWAYKLATW